jgi:hypothetical protein
MLHYDDYNEDEEFVTIAEDMLDPNNPELTYNDDDNDIIPTSFQQKLAGIPRSIRALESFYNPNSQDEWEKHKGRSSSYGKRDH